MPADTRMTWCPTPGSASELVLGADIRCRPRELWCLLRKPGHLNSSVGSLLSLSSWCRSLPKIWRAEWWVPCSKVGSWRQIVQVSQTLSTYPEEPWANHSAQTTEAAKTFFSPDGLPSSSSPVRTNLWSSCTSKGQWRGHRFKRGVQNVQLKLQ